MGKLTTPPTKEKLFFIEKVKRPTSKKGRISKTGNWSPNEIIKLSVCSYMHIKLKLRWKDLCRFISSRSSKQIRNKFKQDLRMFKSLVAHFDKKNKTLRDRLVNNNNLHWQFGSLFKELNLFIGDYTTNVIDNKLNKVLATNIYCFNVDVGQSNVPLFHPLFHDIKSFTFKMSKEDYEVLKRRKGLDGVPILDYSSIVEFLKNKYGFNNKE
jgi:hypothetical protein